MVLTIKLHIYLPILQIILILHLVDIIIKINMKDRMIEIIIILIQIAPNYLVLIIVQVIQKI